jgi:hypothetical protein
VASCRGIDWQRFVTTALLALPAALLPASVSARPAVSPEVAPRPAVSTVMLDGAWPGPTALPRRPTVASST